MKKEAIKFIKDKIEGLKEKKLKYENQDHKTWLTDVYAGDNKKELNNYEKVLYLLQEEKPKDDKTLPNGYKFDNNSSNSTISGIDLLDDTMHYVIDDGKIIAKTKKETGRNYINGTLHIEKEKAERHNDGKLRWSLVDYPSLEEMVKVLEFGAEKYESNNWKKGLYTTKIAESILRHIYSFLDGKDKDEESGLNEVGHILCNAMFLSYMFKFKKDFDDREKK